MKSLKKIKFLRKLSMPHAFTMLLGILVFVGILTWIFNGYETTKIWVEKNDAGEVIKINKDPVNVIASYPGDWFTSIIGGFANALGVIMFLLVLGAYINIVIESGALKAFISKLANKFKSNLDVPDKERYQRFGLKGQIIYRLKLFKETLSQTWIFIPLVFFFSFCGSSYGMAEESLAFYVVIIPLALAAGFDVWTGFLIIFIGCGVGVMGSTINIFSVVQASASAKETIVSETGKEIASLGKTWRWLSWFFLTLFTAGYLMWYGMRVKMNKEKSYVRDLFVVHNELFTKASKEQGKAKLSKRHALTVFLFLITFLLMALSMMFNHLKGLPSMAGAGWSNLENTATENLGPWWELGNFYFAELFVLFFLMMFVIAFINWKGEKKFIDEIMTGGRDFLGVCYAVGIAASIGVILKLSNLQYYIVGKLTNVINVSTVDAESENRLILSLLSYILFIPLTFFIPSTSGLAKASFPILGPAIADNIKTTVPNSLPGVIHGYGFASGFANMFVPTYAVVVGALSITKISYGKFIKCIYKYLLMIFVLGFVLLIIGSFFPLK